LGAKYTKITVYRSNIIPKTAEMTTIEMLTEDESKGDFVA